MMLVVHTVYEHLDSLRYDSETFTLDNNASLPYQVGYYKIA